jgi:choline dehydrogenase-like flavoprotein
VIIDARQLSSPTLSCDVCIVGGGPAGIMLANELGDSGVDVVLLESGGQKFTSEAHDLNRGHVDDPAAHGPLEEYRRRRLGGATTAWGGRCAPFDAEDFEARPDVAFSGWPFGLAELDPYYRRAHRHLDLGAYRYEASASLPPAAAERAMIPGLRSDDVTADLVYRFSPPTNFGKKYGARLGLARSVRVLLHATCLNVVTNEAGTTATAVRVSAGDTRFEVSARRFVLAGGGLEVTRLLLLSNDVQRGGLGNQRELLGRFYMCHVTHHLDVELSSPDIVWDYERTADGVYCQRTLAVRPDRQRAQGLLNHRARVEHPDIVDAGHRNGVLSVSYLTKTVLTRLASNPFLTDKVSLVSRGTQNEPLVDSLGHLRNVVSDLPGVAEFSLRWLRERVLSVRKLPSIVLPNAAGRYTLRFDCEQAPNPDSRVLLADDKDALGMQRLRIDWRSTELDMRSAEQAAAVIGRSLAASNVGRVLRDEAATPLATGGHHLGTTRMATGPDRGVVDENCRVHGVANLYVASGSVFPTCSYANPTLTVVALALRLADHLQQQPAAHPIASGA